MLQERKRESLGVFGLFVFVSELADKKQARNES